MLVIRVMARMEHQVQGGVDHNATMWRGRWTVDGDGSGWKWIVIYTLFWDVFALLMTLIVDDLN